MGLAQRFKDKLDKQNIFESTSIEKNIETQDIKFISKPVTENITVQPKELHSGVIEPVKDLTELPQIKQETIEYVANYENLEVQIIDKIRQTPYWNEFSQSRKKQMIGAYFDKKNNGNCTVCERDEFIRNILDLTK